MSDTSLQIPKQFNAEAAGALSGPKWLVERRVAAAETLDGMALPSINEEVWRYSRIDDLDLEAYGLSGAPTRSLALDEECAELLAAIGACAGIIKTNGSTVVEVELSDAASSAGVRLHGAEAADEEPEALGAAVTERRDGFTDLSDAFMQDVVLCAIPDGVQLEKPIVIVHLIAGEIPNTVCFPRTLVSVGAGASASIVEVFLSDGDRRLVVPVTEIDVADRATLAYTTVQELGSMTWQIAYHASRVGREATLRSFVAAFGGDYARQLTQTELVAENASSELLALYLGDGTQVQDLRTFQEHVAPRTRSELVFKGAVADTARSVYTGLIHMHRGAKRADASQTNRNLVLSEGAHADSVPNLDIEENDVRCSHASAVGPIDPDQLFYLESRGIPREDGERLILLGFFDDLLERAPEAGVATYLRAIVARRLQDGVLAGKSVS